MNALDLYLGVNKALKAGELSQAAELLPELTTKLEALAGRGWHGFVLTGNPDVDLLIQAANKYLGSP